MAFINQLGPGPDYGGRKKGEVAIELLDKLFALFPIGESFDLSDFPYDPSFTDNERLLLRDLYYEIREMLLTTFAYARVYQGMPSQLFLTSEGMAAKEVGGHFAYQQAQKLSIGNSSSEELQTLYSLVSIIGEALKEFAASIDEVKTNLADARVSNRSSIKKDVLQLAREKFFEYLGGELISKDKADKLWDVAEKFVSDGWNQISS